MTGKESLFEYQQMRIDALEKQLDKKNLLLNSYKLINKGLNSRLKDIISEIKKNNNVRKNKNNTR